MLKPITLDDIEAAIKNLELRRKRMTREYYESVLEELLEMRTVKVSGE